MAHLKVQVATDVECRVFWRVLAGVILQIQYELIMVQVETGIFNGFKRHCTGFVSQAGLVREKSSTSRKVNAILCTVESNIYFTNIMH